MIKQFLIQVEMHPGCAPRPGFKQGAELFQLAIDAAHVDTFYAGSLPTVKVVELLDAEDFQVVNINEGLVHFKKSGGALRVLPPAEPHYDFTKKNPQGEVS